MLDAFESTLIIAGSIVAALIVLLVFRRVWLPKKRNQHNEVIGWQISFLGTTYAVIIAFMLADVWNNYQAAETNAEIEANALINMYRVSGGLPAPARSVLESLTRRYAQTMVDTEWPEMMRGIQSSVALPTIASMWKAVLEVHVTDGAERASLDRALADLSSMTEHRRVRQLQSRSSLPFIFWLVLIVGGVMTVLYTCLFDVEETMMHVIQVVGVTFIVSLVLVTIADIDSPYGGAVHIESTAFKLALQTIGQAGDQ